MSGTLYLIPLPLAPETAAVTLPASITPLVQRLQHFIVESEKVSRRFLKELDRSIDINALHFGLLNEHTPAGEIRQLLQPALDGHDLGLMSDAGCPGIADPGAAAVAHAHRLGIRVQPLSGPSSIVLTLMGSGFNGQRFAFHGYLPVATHERERALRELEAESRRRDMTQLFIETPYRNRQLLDTLLKVGHPDTQLCIGAGLTAPDQLLETRSIKAWKTAIPELNKRPAVFAIYSR